MQVSGGTWWCVCTMDGTVLARFKLRREAERFQREHGHKASVSFAKLKLELKSF